MKVIADMFTNENNEFEVLTEKDMNEVRGGGTPKSRDRDIFDFDAE